MIDIHIDIYIYIYIYIIPIYKTFIISIIYIYLSRMCNGIYLCTILRKYIHVFMDHFKRKYIYPLIEGKSLTYSRYIDDIFVIWAGTKNELDQFCKDLNKKTSIYKI